MKNQFLPAIIIGFSLINLLSFILVGADKQKSVNRAERSPEVYFFLMAAFFGSLGVLLGMYFFRHKTQKVYFPVGIGVLLLQQVVLIYLLFKLTTPILN